MKQGWDKKSLMEIASVSTGKWNANHATEGGNYRFYTCAYDYLYCDTKRFEGECLILPGNGVNVGEVFYYNGEFDAYQRTYVISDIKILPKYLHYHMLLHWKALGTKQQYGSATNFIKIGNFKEYEVQYPSLPEQQRIVAILDQCFTAIDKAKANAEQNLKNAKELFESVLNSLIIDDGKLKMEKLGDVCEIKGRIGYRGYTVQDLVQKGEGAITLSPSNIQDNKFITDKCTYISWFKYEESPEIMVFEGDILFVKTGSTYGKVALVENLPEKATINPQFVVLKDIKCSNRFLYYALTTKAFKEKVENIVGGAATPTLSQKNLAEQTIPLPPFEEQQTIVRQLDALRAETQKLEAVYQQKIDDLEELKKSILQKAFKGELRSPEGVASANDGYSPSEKKTKNKISPERA